MNDQPLSNNHAQSQAIYIESDLYNRLREFCDRENIRFLEFLVDSLESAISSEQSIQSIEDEMIELQRKAVKYDYAFNRGFQQGFSFFYLMMKGLGVCRAANEELKMVRKFPVQAPKGDQMKLF